MNFNDLTGQRFGDLVAREYDWHDKKKWLCDCDCGNQTWVRPINLRNGHVKSCGCLRTRHKKVDSINRRAKVLQALMDAPDGLKTNEISRKLGGVSVQSVNSTLSALEDDGQAVKQREGSFNRWFYPMNLALLRAEHKFFYEVRP